MSWLVADDKVLATLDIADTWKTRLKGVLGCERFEGALLTKPAFSVHSIGLKTELDVAYCDANLRVLDIVTMVPNRMGMPRVRARQVIEAPKGSFERWGIRAGDQLEVRL